MFDPKCISQMATPTVLLETLYLSHSIITETPMVGIHQIKQKSVANQKRAELITRRDKTKKETNKQNRFHNN